MNEERERWNERYAGGDHEALEVGGDDATVRLVARRERA